MGQAEENQGGAKIDSYFQEINFDEPLTNTATHDRYNVGKLL